jgi:hypothetical protein
MYGFREHTRIGTVKNRRFEGFEDAVFRFNMDIFSLTVSCLAAHPHHVFSYHLIGTSAIIR